MQVRDSVLMDFVRVGLASMAFILLAKFLFVGKIKVPGISELVAAV